MWMQMEMHENVFPFRKKNNIWDLKNSVKQPTKYRQKSVQLVDNPVQAAVEHFPEMLPPLLGYLWFAF